MDKTNLELWEVIKFRIGELEKLANTINDKKAPLDWVCQQLNITVEQAKKEIDGKFESRPTVSYACLA